MQPLINQAGDAEVESDGSVPKHLVWYGTELLKNALKNRHLHSLNRLAFDTPQCIAARCRGKLKTVPPTGGD